jgi:hypothetical protein
MMLLPTWNLALAEEPDPTEETILVRKGLLEEARDRIDATDRKLVIVTGQRDSLQVDLWRSEATKPVKRSVLDTFEFGMVTGATLVMLIIWALRAQLQ